MFMISKSVFKNDGDLSKIERENTRLSLLKAGETFSGSGSNVMPLFGPPTKTQYSR